MPSTYCYENGKNNIKRLSRWQLERMPNLAYSVVQGAVASAVAAVGGTLKSSSAVASQASSSGPVEMESEPVDKAPQRLSNNSVKGAVRGGTSAYTGETAPLSVTSNTDRSLVRDHLAVVAESYISMSSSILLYLHSRGRATAQSIVAGALEKLGGIAGIGENKEKLGHNYPDGVITGTSLSSTEADSAHIRAYLHTRVNYPDVKSGKEKQKEGKEGKEGKEEANNNEEVQDGNQNTSPLSRFAPQRANPVNSAKDTQTVSDMIRDFTMRPVAAMATTLEDFVSLCPVTSRATLEQYYPYSLLHCGLIDISLGKGTELEGRASFSTKAA